MGSPVLYVEERQILYAHEFIGAHELDHIWLSLVNGFSNIFQAFLASFSRFFLPVDATL